MLYQYKREPLTQDEANRLMEGSGLVKRMRTFPI